MTIEHLASQNPKNQALKLPAENIAITTAIKDMK
jgi:hypothetical protein